MEELHAQVFSRPSLATHTTVLCIVSFRTGVLGVPAVRAVVVAPRQLVVLLLQLLHTEVQFALQLQTAQLVDSKSARLTVKSLRGVFTAPAPKYAVVARALVRGRSLAPLDMGVLLALLSLEHKHATRTIAQFIAKYPHGVRGLRAPSPVAVVPRLLHARLM